MVDERYKAKAKLIWRITLILLICSIIAGILLFLSGPNYPLRNSTLASIFTLIGMILIYPTVILMVISFNMNNKIQAAKRASIAHNNPAPTNTVAQSDTEAANRLINPTYNKKSYRRKLLLVFIIGIICILSPLFLTALGITDASGYLGLLAVIAIYGNILGAAALIAIIYFIAKWLKSKPKK